MRVLGLFLLLMLLGTVMAQEEPDFYRFYTYAEATKLAREYPDRVLLLYFRSNHCPYCAQMETFVLGDPEVTEQLARCFVVGTVTLEKAPELFKRHGVRGTPFFLFLRYDPARKTWVELGRVFGSMPRSTFLDKLRAVCDGRSER